MRAAIGVHNGRLCHLRQIVAVAVRTTAAAATIAISHVFMHRLMFSFPFKMRSHFQAYALKHQAISSAIFLR